MKRCQQLLNFVKLLQNKLISVTKDGSLNFKKGKNLSLLERMQVLHMMDVPTRIIFFYIIHHEYVISTAVKLVNFIQARGLNHRLLHTCYKIWMLKIQMYFKKGKAITVTGCGGPQVCETSRLPHLLGNRLTYGGEVVSLMCQSPFTPRKIPGTQFCYRLS
jgi:hypothetical protein